MELKALDDTRDKLLARVQLYDHLCHICTHGGFFANVAFVAPSELSEMLAAAALPSLETGALLALANSLEKFFTLPPILSLHGCRRLVLELQWWLKQRSTPSYDAEVIENRISLADDENLSVLLPMRPLHLKQVFVLPKLPAQPSPAATCRVLDAASKNASLSVGFPSLEVLDLTAVQWAHHADAVITLAHTLRLLMQFSQQLDAGLQIAWSSPPNGTGEGGANQEAATAAHMARMASACSSVAAFDAYMQRSVLQPVLELLRGVATAKLSTVMTPLQYTQLWDTPPPSHAAVAPLDNSRSTVSDSTHAGHAAEAEEGGDTAGAVAASPAGAPAVTGPPVKGGITSTQGHGGSCNTALGERNADAINSRAHDSPQPPCYSEPSQVLSSAFGGVRWHLRLPGIQAGQAAQ